MPRKRDPSLPTPFEIRYAVKRAALLLSDQEREDLQALLRKKPPTPLNQVLAFFQDKPAAQQWLERTLYPSPSELTRSYEGLSGHPGEIPARSLWKCPQCGFTWRVLRKGRPVPPCPNDGSRLEPVLKKEQNDAG